jgi:hypothetical protein
LFLALSNVSLASEFNYSQAALSYISGDNDSGSSFDGYEVDLAYDASRLVIGLRIQLLQQDAIGGTLDASLYTGGIGSYWELKPGLDVYGSIYGGQYDVEAPLTKLADTRVMILTAGLRKKLQSELDGKLYVASYQFDQDVEDQTRLGAVLEYTPDGSALGIRGIFETHSDADQFYLGVVYNY